MSRPDIALHQQIVDEVAKRGEASLQDIATVLGEDHHKLWNTFAAMTKKGALRRVRRGVYALPNSAASAPTNGNGQHEVKAKVARRVSQDDRLAAMLEVSGMHPRTREDWLRVLQFIEVTRGAMA